MTLTTSIAMTARVREELATHLRRDDGQEDICVALYRRSTGATRTTALLATPLLPGPDDRAVHGNATINGTYVLRAAALAAAQGCGVAVLHSHPRARGWQQMSGPDHDAESAFANLVREMTSLPLVGLTLAGADGSWSARHWDRGVGRNVKPTGCDNVRVVGDRLQVTWDDERVKPPSPDARQARTRSAWGDHVQADLARRRILVVGAGSVGLDLIVRLAASGVRRLTVMDFDAVELHNLDRLIGAGLTDAVLRRPKIHVARREALRAATASRFDLAALNLSVCEPEGLAVALDHDLVFCAVDRPWPRAVLNELAYADLVPVIDGGIALDAFPNGLMRNATWRSHVMRPGRPCMACNHQLDGGAVAADIEGLLDQPEYIGGLPLAQRDRLHRAASNVAPLSVSAAASMLAQYVSFCVAPGGFGEPGPLQYVLSTHQLDHLKTTGMPACPYESDECAGDSRADLTRTHPAAEAARATQASLSWALRALRACCDGADRAWPWIERAALRWAHRALRLEGQVMARDGVGLHPTNAPRGRCGVE